MKKVCLLIHGYISDADDFGKLPDVLKKYYDEVVICDLPGHNTYGRIYQFSFQETVKVLYDLISKYLEEAIVDLIGYSLGGVIASYFAKQYKFHKVVLLSPSIKYVNPVFPNTIKHYISEVASLFGRHIAKLEEKKVREQVNLDFSYIFFRFRTRFTLSTWKTFIDFINANNKLQEHIASPLLIMRGEFDELVPKATVYTILDECDNENKQFISLPHSGHLFLRFEEQDEIIQEIVTFLIGE